MNLKIGFKNHFYVLGIILSFQCSLMFQFKWTSKLTLFISTPGNQLTREEITSAGRPGIGFKIQAGKFPCSLVIFACGEAVLDDEWQRFWNLRCTSRMILVQFACDAANGTEHLLGCLEPQILKFQACQILDWVDTSLLCRALVLWVGFCCRNYNRFCGQQVQQGT